MIFGQLHDLERRSRALGLLCLSMLLMALPGRSQAPARAPSPASPTSKTWRVATRQIAPFVMQQDGKLTGFSIELWNKIAEQMNVKSQFVMSSNVSELLGKVKGGRAEVGIAAVSVTAKRDHEFDFSQPMFDAGLSILVRDQSTGTSNPLPSFLALVFSPVAFQFLVIIVAIVVLPAHFIWFFERHQHEGMITSKSYFPGIFESVWWTASTLATQADSMPRGPIGRVFAVFWMFISVIFVAYFTATLTATLTVQQLHGDIKGPEDLPGKHVATIKGSTSDLYLQEKKIPTQEFSQIEDAYDALSKKQVDAVVYDAPILLYYASHDGNGKTQVVGAPFRKESYGIVFPINSPNRKAVDKALLTLQEDGTYQDLYDKYFSAKAG